MSSPDASREGAFAVETLYNALVTAMIVSLVARRGADTAREYVFRHFRRQHLEKFLPGLQKLGLAGLPPAVACALYHYHSNALGGVRTEYVRESDRKAWVRYPPPRWMWRGTAIAAIPHEVSAAMLHGWHGHNGTSLGNPNLGFICTGMTVDGMPGLEGYYLEYDRPLAEGERVRFAYGEASMPRFDPTAAPALDAANWPAERLARVRCRYAMEYVRTLVVVLEGLLGAQDASRELGRVARLVGLQFYDETASAAQDFKQWMADALRAQGEDVVEDAASIRMSRWRLAEGLGLADPLAAFAGWNELWAGACAAHDRFLRMEALPVLAEGAVAAQWTIA